MNRMMRWLGPVLVCCWVGGAGVVAVGPSEAPQAESAAVGPVRLDASVPGTAVAWSSPRPGEHLAYDASGTIHAVFSASSATGGVDIFYRRVGRQVGPEPAFPVSGWARSNRDPVLLMDSKGSVHLAWGEIEGIEGAKGLRYVKLSREYLAVEESHFIVTGSDPSPPQLLSSPAGDVLWWIYVAPQDEDFENFEFRIHESRDFGRSWDPVVSLSCGGYCGDGRLHPAVSGDGLVVLWTRRGSRGFEVVSRMWNPDRGWAGEDLTVSDAARGTIVNLDVRTAGGRAMALWQERRMNHRQIAMAFATGGTGGWGENVVIETDSGLVDARFWVGDSGEVQVLGWEISSIGVRRSSRAWSFPVSDQGTPGDRRLLWETDHRLLQLTAAPLGNRLVLVGLLEGGREGRKVFRFLPDKAEQPSWVDVGDAAGYYDGLGVSQGAFGGRFAVGVRSGHEISGIHGSALAQVKLMLVEAGAK